MESSKHYRNAGVFWVVLCYCWALFDVWHGGFGDGLSGGLWFLWGWGTVNLVAAAYWHTKITDQKHVRARMEKLVNAYVDEARNLAKLKGVPLDELCEQVNEERRTVKKPEG